MISLSPDQIRQYRLRAHHLDRWYPDRELTAIAGACGLQNTPPGAWETAVFNRIGGCTLSDLRQHLETERDLLQAWSIRGAPLVFPTAESAVFLNALTPRGEEPWIYTDGIRLALDHLGMGLPELLTLLIRVLPELDDQVIRSKVTLDATLAQWMAPWLPVDKRILWEGPSMYGSPDKQTVGGAVVSFLLRPCSFLGLVVFGRREGTAPTFTSYQAWTGQPLAEDPEAAGKLAAKFLHCYGPATQTELSAWLGSSPQQAARSWHMMDSELEPVRVLGKTRYVLARDLPALVSPPPLQRPVHLLGGHDPYLGLFDRSLILNDPSLQKQLWQTVANPGAVLWQGSVAGIWRPQRKGQGLTLAVTLWADHPAIRAGIAEAAGQYAAFRALRLTGLDIQSCPIP